MYNDRILNQEHSSFPTSTFLSSFYQNFGINPRDAKLKSDQKDAYSLQFRSWSLNRIGTRAGVEVGVGFVFFPVLESESGSNRFKDWSRIVRESESNSLGIGNRNRIKSTTTHPRRDLFALQKPDH